MKWCEVFPASTQPDKRQIADFIQNPLWDEINGTLQSTYKTEPKYSYSGCSMQPGWNVKYQKSGKSLCTLYPMQGYFIALVVVGPKEMAEAELLLPFLSNGVREIFANTKTGQGAKWLMLDIWDKETLEDALRLVALRAKQKR